AQLSVELARRGPFSAGVAYEVGSQTLNLGTRSFEDAAAGIDQKIFRSPPGQMIFGSLRPTMFLDLRDDPARPRSGLLMQVSGDFLRSFKGSATDITDQPRVHVNLLKVQGLIATYV